jgi:hypothetical protein
MFTHQKVAQMAAYIATKIGAPRINYMRLIKLMYLSDRENFARNGEPISFDDLYSLDHGLVLSQTLDVVEDIAAINNIAPWGEYFSPRKSDSDYSIDIKRPVSRDELDYLSDADLESIDATLKKFGRMSEWDLSGYMHKHCPEWTDPHGSSIHVDEEGLLQSLGATPEQAKAIATKLSAERTLDRLLNRR